jgi:hypothetical protein
MGAMEILDLAQNDGFRLARAGSVLLAYQSTPALQGRDIELVSEVGLELLKARPKFAVLFILAPGIVPTISGELRAATAKQRRLFGTNIVSSAIVDRGEGLGRAVIQLFLAGYALLVPTPIRLFSDFDEALGWMRRVPGQVAGVDALDHAAIVRHFGELGDASTISV